MQTEFRARTSNNYFALVVFPWKFFRVSGVVCEISLMKLQPPFTASRLCLKACVAQQGAALKWKKNQQIGKKKKKVQANKHVMLGNTQSLSRTTVLRCQVIADDTEKTSQGVSSCRKKLVHTIIKLKFRGTVIMLNLVLYSLCLYQCRSLDELE